ncbi:MULTISPECIES: TRAP transporter small permease [Pseudomonas]|uniref:TRAP transporter small permease n=1 Tax=Pseudomonas TaxID=286 RepID=UPI00249A9EEB|nr:MULTISPECIES: TRAP transporter small permease [Pseudomonas]
MTRLKPLYQASGILSGVFMVLICALVLAQIIARLCGTLVPSSDEFAGYAMAASGFLGLPYALHRGSHIRVELLLKAFAPPVRRVLEALSTALGLLVCGYLAWYCGQFTLESYQFGEVSSGMLPIPMWIPQCAMALGTLILAIAMLDRLICALRGRPFEEAGDTVMSE